MSESFAIRVGQAMRESKALDAAEFVRLHRPRIFRLALSIAGDKDLAEDITQEAAVKAFRGLQKQDIQEVQAWVRTITVRTALNALRRARHEELPAEMEGSACGTDSRLAVQHVLARLSPEQRTILALAFHEGLKYAEIADALSIPLGTVASRISAARAAFRREWEK